MGGEPWMYFVPYEHDLQNALDKLKEREFLAGRYYPVMSELPFPVVADGPAPGPQHASIEDAREDANADGTRSILDMNGVATEPRARPAGDRMAEMEAAMQAAFAKAQPGGVIDLGSLDLMSLMGDPNDFGVVTPVAPEELERLYGTTRPSLAAVAKAPDFLEAVDRGMGVYVIVYDGEQPTDICFAGYSFD